MYLYNYINNPILGCSVWIRLPLPILCLCTDKFISPESFYSSMADC